MLLCDTGRELVVKEVQIDPSLQWEYKKVLVYMAQLMLCCVCVCVWGGGGGAA